MAAMDRTLDIPDIVGVDFISRRNPRYYHPLQGAFQSGLVPVTGNSLGGLTNVGQSPSVVNPNRPDPLLQQFSFSSNSPLLPTTYWMSTT